MKTSKAFKMGFLNPFLRYNSSSNAPYVVVFRSGLVPTDNATLRSELITIDPQKRPSQNWKTLDPKFVAAMVAYTPAGASQQFELVNFSSTMGNVNWLTPSAGVVTHALLFPCGNGMQTHFNGSAFTSGASSSANASNGCIPINTWTENNFNWATYNSGTSAQSVACLIDPCDIRMGVGTAGSGPACIVVSAGEAGSTHPLILANATVAAGQYPVVTRCTFALV